MLARSQSDAGARLRRAKSTSSAYSHASPHPVERADPVVTRRHAVAAATAAFDRAYRSEDTSARVDRRPEIPQRKRNTGRASEGSHFPSRQSRSSFDGGLRAGRASHGPEVPHEPESYVSSPAGNSAVSEPAASRLSDSAQHRPRVHATPCPPSSRTVRKSRSMYGTHSCNDGMFPASQALTENLHVRHVNNEKTTKSPATATSSHIRPAEHAVQVSKPPAYQAPGKENVAVEVRGQDLQDVQQPALRTRPSFILGPFKKRQEKTARCSMLAGNVTYDSIAPAPNHRSGDPLLMPATESRPRSMSNSLKSKLKRVFRKPSNNLPVQQIDASRSHFGDYPSVSPAVHSSFGDVPSPDEELLSRARSRTPILKSAPTSPHLVARRSISGRSEGGVSIAKSRVTSWTNSSAGNTVTSRGSKRLSVINEDDRTHESPPTPKQRGLPLLRHLSTKKSRRKLSGSKEYADLYSALVQRIDEVGLMPKNSPGVDNIGGSERPKTIHDTLPSQTRTSSITSKFSRRTRATIRTVSPEERNEDVGIAHGAPLTPKSAYHMQAVLDSDNSPGAEEEKAFEALHQEFSDLTVRRTRPRQTIEVTSPTAEQIANRMERTKNRWKTPLEDSAPVFFPCSAGHGSTGRSAIVSRSVTPQAPSANGADRERSPGDFHAVSEPVPFKLREAVSPSVYSRTTDIHSPRPNDSVVSLARTDCGETGTATIIVGTTAAAYPIGSPTPNKEMRSTRSSRDWRSWLSREVADLTVLPQEDIAIRGQFEVKESKHRREHAQIVDGEYTSIQPDEPAKNRPRKSSRPKLEDRPSSRMNERFPYLETSKIHNPQETRLTRKTSPAVENAATQPVSKENVPANQLGRESRLTRPLSLQQISANLRSDSSLAQYTTNGAEDTKGDASASPSPSKARHTSTRSAHKPKSAADLRGQCSPPSHAATIRRKPVGPAPLDDRTLRHISQGPYGPPATPSPRRNKENNPGVGAAAIGPADGPGRRGAPTSGQRMAADFLRRRAAVETRLASESPVFL